MTNEQIVAIAAPMAFNGALIGLTALWMRAKFDAMRDLRRAELRRVPE